MTDQPNNEETSTPTPYKGQYRKDVYEDDPKNADEIEDPVQTATPKNLMGSEKEVNYKKRYDDLKRHYDHKLNEWRTKEQTLMAEKKLGNTKLPKTPEELDDFRKKYPDVYDVVQSISTMNAESKVREIEGRLEELTEKEQDAIVRTAEQELLAIHPDFTELRETDDFKQWLEDQPPSISDGLYKNNTDSRWASRVIDLYKADRGTRTRKTSSKASAQSVTRTSRTDAPRKKEDRIWTRDEIAKLKPHEFAKLEEEIDKASREGRIT